MTVTYFKRYRMQCDLRRGVVETQVALPPHYQLVPWDNRLVRSHADAKYNSFREEIDSNVFPCLGDAEGCLRLMNEISCRQGFLGQATWLITKTNPRSDHIENCGTVQGIREQVEVGSIQNLGIVPEHRGFGLGSALLHQSLLGFHSEGIKFVTLEVTSHNLGALRLYKRMGFKIVRTVYKSIDLAYA